MLDILENVPKTDPVAIPEQKAMIDRFLEQNHDVPGSVMVFPNELQANTGFVSPTMQTYLARQMHVPLHQVHGANSFYSFFTTEPCSQHTVKLCMGTACYMGGAPQLIE